MEVKYFLSPSNCARKRAAHEELTQDRSKKPRPAGFGRGGAAVGAPAPAIAAPAAAAAAAAAAVPASLAGTTGADAAPAAAPASDADGGGGGADAAAAPAAAAPAAAAAALSSALAGDAGAIVADAAAADVAPSGGGGRGGPGAGAPIAAAPVAAGPATDVSPGRIGTDKVTRTAVGASASSPSGTADTRGGGGIHQSSSPSMDGTMPEKSNPDEGAGRNSQGHCAVLVKTPQDESTAGDGNETENDMDGRGEGSGRNTCRSLLKHVPVLLDARLDESKVYYQSECWREMLHYIPGVCVATIGGYQKKVFFEEGLNFPYNIVTPDEKEEYPNLFYTRFDNSSVYNGQWILGWLAEVADKLCFDVIGASRYYDQVEKLLKNEDGKSYLVSEGRHMYHKFKPVNLVT